MNNSLLSLLKYMTCKVTPTHIPDVLVQEPNVFGGSRGFFFESFSQQNFNQATDLDVHFVQDNHSRSAQGVLRGAVFDAPVHERCIAWNDPAIGITWPEGLRLQVSAKDQAGLGLVQAEVFS